MLEDAKKGMVQRRKILVSDVRWRPDEVTIRRRKAKRTTDFAVNSTVETVAEDEMMRNAIEKVLAQESEAMKEERTSDVVRRKPIKPKRTRKYSRNTFGFKWAAMAFIAATAVVVGIAYLTNKNTPDASLKAAAIRNGVNAVYPEYTPRGYVLSDIVSENSKVTLSFKNAETGAGYTLIEEGVDETTKLKEYVDEVFGEDCVRIDENGTVIYIGNGGAVWISDEVLFKLKITSGTLTRKQMVTIATTK